MNEFVEFPKIYRYSRECLVTEKIDGTNAQIFIWDVSSNDPTEPLRGIGDPPPGIPWIWSEENIYVAAGSRNKWLAMEKNKDNFGFARWVSENVEQLIYLGHGRHYGEWWGSGIQRGYGLKDKRFSLFNVVRWTQKDKPPDCCSVVPVVSIGQFDDPTLVANAMDVLSSSGSMASPGFNNPEGIMIHHLASGVSFKKTFGDDGNKSHGNNSGRS